MTDLDEQVEEERWVRESVGAPGAGPSTEDAGPARMTSVVAVVSGDGIGRIFALWACITSSSAARP